MKYKFNRCLEGIKPSQTIGLMEKVKALNAQGHDVLSLTGGEPDFDTPASASLAAIAGICCGHTHYTSGRGIPSLRRRIAQKLQEENGIKCTEQDIFITPGGKFALYLAMRALINPGDEVLILDPSWVSYQPITLLCAGVPVSVELSFEDNYAITAEKLDNAITPNSRVIIINTPNNPTGRMLTTEEADVIAEFACRHNLIVISDEIYEKLVYDDNKHISLASLKKLDGRVITLNGFSKFAAMPGWRLGYMVAPSPVLDKVHMLYQHTMTCVSEFAQEAAKVALDCKNDLEIMRLSYQKRRDFFISELNAIPGVNCLKPQGAFYVWARIERDNMTSIELAEFLLEKAQIAVIPGDAFGAGLGTEKCVRMYFATEQEKLEETVTRMRKVMT